MAKPASVNPPLAELDVTNDNVETPFPPADDEGDEEDNEDDLEEVEELEQSDEDEDDIEATARMGAPNSSEEIAETEKEIEQLEKVLAVADTREEG